MVTDISLHVQAREIVAVVGASGSGKSLLAHAILGILPGNASVEGTMDFLGAPLTPARCKRVRGHDIVLVPQGVSFLDPLMRTGAQIRNGSNAPAASAKERELLSAMSLPARTSRLYPFELSGGMARRVMVATAMMGTPQLVIADEPTPGLHREAALQVMAYFRDMADRGAAVLLITHDLSLALSTADRIVVLYAGTSVEEASAHDFDLVQTLRHPYTRALVRAMPQRGFIPLEGTQPTPDEAISGCPFASRCALKVDACAGIIPTRSERKGRVRCVLTARERAGESCLP